MQSQKYEINQRIRLILEEQDIKLILYEISKNVKFIKFQELQFKNQISKGGFGAIYLVNYENHIYAAKRIYLQKYQNLQNDQLKNLVMSILLEVKILGEAKSVESIINIHGFTYDQEFCFLLDYCPQGDLTQFQQISVESKIRIMIQICSAVLYLHKQNLAHRDIKPQNILINQHSKAVLIDFGLTVKLQTGYLDSTAKLDKNDQFGSLMYMAPEQTDINQKLTKKCDIWAIGCTMIELFGNAKPYSECCDLRNIYGKLTSFIPPQMPSKIDSDIKEIIQACINPSYKLRPKVDQILQQLSQAAQKRMFQCQDCNQLQIQIKQLQEEKVQFASEMNQKIGKQESLIQKYSTENQFNDILIQNLQKQLEKYKQELIESKTQNEQLQLQNESLQGKLAQKEKQMNLLVKNFDEKFSQIQKDYQEKISVSMQKIQLYEKENQQRLWDQEKIFNAQQQELKNQIDQQRQQLIHVSQKYRNAETKYKKFKKHYEDLQIIRKMTMQNVFPYVYLFERMSQTLHIHNISNSIQQVQLEFQIEQNSSSAQYYNQLFLSNGNGEVVLINLLGKSIELPKMNQPRMQYSMVGLDD